MIKVVTAGFALMVCVNAQAAINDPLNKSDMAPAGEPKTAGSAAAVANDFGTAGNAGGLEQAVQADTVIEIAAIDATPFTTTHYEAENAARVSGCRIEQENFPYVGSGYAVMEGEGAALAWRDITAPHAGLYTLIIKYANDSGADRPCTVRVNGSEAAVMPFPSVYDDACWYWNARLTVNLKRGRNTIELTAQTPAGGPNIDNLAVSSHGLAEPAGEYFDVRAYGGDGDGATDDTQAIQSAIDACTPGGTVVLSNGVFMSGTIRLKSDMTLWIDTSATLRAIQDAAKFEDTDPPTANVSVADELGQSFIHSQGAHHLTLTGGGTVDGNGECEIWDEEKDESIRPVPIYLTQGTHLTIRNLDIVRGAMWSVVPLECDDVIIDGLNIESTYGMNKDGIDPCDCHRVLISNCTLTLEDDALCPKSGHPRGCEDITYRNITVNRTICGLVKLGTKTYGHFKNIVFEDLALYGAIAHKASNVGINLSTVDGAEIENIVVRRVNMRNAATALFIMHGAGMKARTPAGFPDKPGAYVRNILIEDVDARECHDPFGNFITGTRDGNGKVHKVTDVTLRNVRVECKGGVQDVPDHPKEYTRQYPNYDWCGGVLPAWGYYIRHAERITFENCSATVAPKDVRQQTVLQDATEVTDEKFCP